MTVTRPSEILQSFEHLNIWRRNGERAPHKPLLILMALALFQRGVQDIPFCEYEARLSDLLREFAPQRRTLHPELPFVRLKNDAVWEVTLGTNREHVLLENDLTKGQLRNLNATGHFSTGVQTFLQSDPKAITMIARVLLTAHFPESIHSDILDAVGLALDDATAYTDGADIAEAKRRRDPAFREAVLTAYQYRCALCDLDLRIGNITIGLEAAHIKWHQASGPDVVENGIALCCLHHKLFDIGAFTLGDRRRVLVSEKAHGGRSFEEILLRHHGGQLNAPVRTEHHPAGSFVEWHREQVFKGSARPL
ncbi:phosphorothioated DNA-binding restriction endonuclease [Caballeronia sp. LZ035]|uniref:phosphorothioated DNA-binding restriction endonuclease n=1 Tax=Caballeronia sp. LZ035 TaxID=3038568 RepID=UPI002863B005|nr:HNH endonuclease [Caballeronia sp. LZ035]MDR5755652.1 HNH endonuclease [Caballeronia sp. LZ035]